MLPALFLYFIYLAYAANINVDDWKRHTVFENCTLAHEPVIEGLFEILADDAPLRIDENLTLTANEKRARFLHFVTGTSFVPAVGFSGIDFSIRCNDNPDLPLLAHTCFNTVELPLCNKEQLFEKFKDSVCPYVGF